MNREVLHRFFMGNVTVQEGMAIKAWVERSEENKRTFIKERRLFDALMLQDEKKFVAKITTAYLCLQRHEDSSCCYDYIDFLSYFTN